VRDLAKRSDLISLNGATVRERWRLPQIIEGCVRHRFGGIAPWRDQLQVAGLEKSARQIKDAGLVVTGLCRGGLFTAPEEVGRQAAIEDNLRAIDEAAMLGARCLVMVLGGLPGGSKSLPEAWRQIEDGLSAIRDHAHDAGVPIALEPLHPMYAADRSCVTMLRHALDMCDRLDPGAPREPGRRPFGVAIDVYHVWFDPDLEAQIGRAGSDRRIHAFHVSDWRVPTRDLLLDRAMMGDGMIDIRRIRGLVEATGYDGLVEVEIFSKEDWWKRDPDEVLRVILERFQSAV
jgi:sugar phosphate isomerase/epimerase